MEQSSHQRQKNTNIGVPITYLSNTQVLVNWRHHLATRVVSTGWLSIKYLRELKLKKTFSTQQLSFWFLRKHKYHLPSWLLDIKIPKYLYISVTISEFLLGSKGTKKWSCKPQQSSQTHWPQLCQLQLPHQPRQSSWPHGFIGPGSIGAFQVQHLDCQVPYWPHCCPNLWFTQPSVHKDNHCRGGFALRLSLVFLDSWVPKIPKKSLLINVGKPRVPVRQFLSSSILECWPNQANQGLLDLVRSGRMQFSKIFCLL